jgi:SNF2 family DNA or RNA helicase
MDNEYELDVDGYVKIKFLDTDDCSSISSEESSRQDSDEASDSHSSSEETSSEKSSSEGLSDKEDSDKDSNKEDSDKDSDKEDSDKDSDKEDSDKDSDKEDSDKDSDKEDSDISSAEESPLSSSSDSHPSEKNKWSSISSNDQKWITDEDLLVKVKNKTLVKNDLLSLDLTDIGRLAYFNNYTKQFVYDQVGLRPFPLDNKYKIKHYQADAIRWMMEREMSDTKKNYGVTGGIIYMTMGLGKSLIALALTLFSKKTFPSIIIVSKTLLHAWVVEQIEKFIGNRVKILYAHRDFMSQRDLDSITRKQIMNYDVVFTTYDTCRTAFKKGGYLEEIVDRGDEHSLQKGKIIQINARTREQADNPKIKGLGFIYNTPWDRVICDESQKFANPNSILFKAVMAIYGQHKWCLSGTVIRNYRTDIWSQLRWLGYDGVETATEWKRSQEKYIVHDLQRYIYTASNKDVNIILPLKREYIIRVVLDDKQKTLYLGFEGIAKETFDRLISGDPSITYSSVFVVLCRLRQSAIAPYLVTAKSKRETKSKKAKEAERHAEVMIKKAMDKAQVGKWIYDIDGTAGIESAKMKKVAQLVRAIPKDEKIIIFSMFVSCLDLVCKVLEKKCKDVKFLQIDGSTKGRERSYALKKFRQDPETKILLMPYTVGSEGINLQEANHVILVDSWWNRSVRDQGVARAWRNGQKKEVHVYDLTAEIAITDDPINPDTVENRMMMICREKKFMSDEYMNGTEKIDKGMKTLDRFTLGRLLGIYK